MKKVIPLFPALLLSNTSLAHFTTEAHSAHIDASVLPLALVVMSAICCWLYVRRNRG